MKERKLHRKIWVQTFGEIPVDHDGRSYEIHHINGDHADNRIENLQCVSIHEHLEIHFRQQDWGAVAAISRRLQTPPEIQKKLNSLAGCSAKERKLGWHDPELKEYFREGARKGGKAHKGMRWFNNGKENTKAFEAPDESWTLGRLPGNFGFEKGRVLGRFWNKDGKNKRSIECPGEGWVLGKFLTPEQRARRIEIAKGQVGSRTPSSTQHESTLCTV